MRIFLLILFLLIIQLYSLSAQRSLLKDSKQQFEMGKKFYSDIYVLPDEAPDSVKIIVVYRISYQTLTFMKNNNNGQDIYLSVPNVEVEFQDTDGIIRKRIFREDSVFINTYDETVSAIDYIYGLLTTRMKTGKYTVSAFLRCANTQLLKSKVFALIEFKNFNKEKIISEPIITSILEPDKGIKVKPYILGIGIPFSSEGASIIIPVSYENEFEKFKYIIKYTKPKEKYFDWGDEFNFSGAVVPIKNSSISLDLTDPKESPIASVKPYTTLAGGLNQGLLNIIITSDKLVPGNYELNVVRDNSKDTLKRLISVVWEDMPLSLSDPEYAVDAMYYVLTDEQYETMKDGNPQEISKKILDFWKVKDPTPKTAFNEAMAEYFKRVDFAMQNYKSKSSKDGAKTDRGKIYILYGKPTKTEKTLGEKQNTEVWKYEKFKKEFIFKTNSAGNYILLQVIEIK
ncbi:MAG: GWxTD domain-containing protein [Bacteroidetes bacterium]|nr:GWxTD domain-containing protein [Bacteroidota bacterium]